MGLPLLLLHHECKILSILTIVASYFVPWANSPLIRLHAKLLSPHSCTVGPPTRVCTVVSSGPKSWVPFLKPLFFIFVFCFPVFRGEFHFMQDVCDEIVFVTRRSMLFSFTHPVFTTRPTCGHHVPHVPSVVPHPLRLPSCAVFRIFFHHSCVWGLPPSPYFSTFTLSSRKQSPHSFFIANPLHGAPHTFHNFFVQRRPFHLHPYLSGHRCWFLSGIRPTFLLFVFSSGIISSLSLLPILFSNVC